MINCLENLTTYSRGYSNTKNGHRGRGRAGPAAGKHGHTNANGL